MIPHSAVGLPLPPRAWRLVGIIDGIVAAFAVQHVRNRVDHRAITGRSWDDSSFATFCESYMFPEPAPFWSVLAFQALI
jgi:hypothetical protein